MEPSLIAALVAAAAAAGFVDAIAGGGGLITVPVLMLAGLSPEQALATNKVQGSFGAATAAFSYGRSGLVDLRRQLRTAALAFAAAALGLALVENGWRVLFTRTTDLVQKLQSARRDLQLEAAIAKLDKYHLLILDDLAYVSKDQAETSVLFELIAERYEVGPVIGTGGMSTVHRGVDPHRGPVLATVQHQQREVDVGAGDQPHDGQRERLRAAGAHAHATDLEGRPGHRQRPRLLRRTASGGRPPT